ncbi:16842_t:CDS:1, partial [Racocetra fulgida]
TCTFTTDEIIICLDLNKMDVCLKNEESDTESAFFEKGNYLFVMFLDYNDFMFKTKKISGQAPAGSLGENLNLATGNTGIPSFIGDGSIESAWLPKMQAHEMQRLMQKITNCCDE